MFAMNRRHVDSDDALLVNIHNAAALPVTKKEKTNVHERNHVDRIRSSDLLLQVISQCDQQKIRLRQAAEVTSCLGESPD